MARPRILTCFDLVVDGKVSDSFTSAPLAFRVRARHCPKADVRKVRKVVHQDKPVKDWPYAEAGK